MSSSAIQPRDIHDPLKHYVNMVNDCLFSLLSPFSSLSFLSFLVIRSSCLSSHRQIGRRSCASLLFFLSFPKLTRERLKSVRFFSPPRTRDYYDEHRVARAFILSALKIPALSRPQCFTDASASPLRVPSALFRRHSHSPGDTSIQRRALANFQSHQSSRGFESLGEHYLHLGMASKRPPAHAKGRQTLVDLSFQFVLSLRVRVAINRLLHVQLYANLLLLYSFSTLARERERVFTPDLLFLFLLPRRRPFFLSFSFLFSPVLVRI